METIATFTLRDLNRQPAKVLGAVSKFGRAEVRTRNGDVFTIRPKTMRSPKDGTDIQTSFRTLWQRQRELGHIAPSAADNDRINRLIAGEE